jgi:hypothetical protein
VTGVPAATPEDRLRHIIDQAPPLTAEQVERLRRGLLPSADEGAGHA